MPNPNIKEDGKATQFSKGKSGNPNGRPRKIYKILKESGYSKDDIRTAMNEIAWLPLDKVNKLINKKNAPVIVKVLANAYKRASTKGDYKFIKEIIEHAIGKPTQPIDLGDKSTIRVTIKKNGV